MRAQHDGLTPERWASFTFDQQILMIGNEMNRARKLFTAEDRPLLDKCYERILRLVDLTADSVSKPTARRELLRWRDVVASLYVSSASRADEHDAAFRCLLRFTPGASTQIPLLLEPKSGRTL